MNLAPRSLTLVSLLIVPLVVLVIGGASRLANASSTHGAPTKVGSATSGSIAPAALNPSRGSEIGRTYEAFLSPHQEPDEESNTPAQTPAMFKSTQPSLTRDQRAAAGHRGHGVVRFSKDLSRAWVDVAVEGLKVADINMFHIHCGKPGILGPILVDFSLLTDIQQNFADGVFSVEVTNAAITGTTAAAHGAIGAFTAGCVIPSPSLSGLAPTKASTVAGMATIAEEGELYFNLHTKGQTYFGDIRGQWARVE